MRIHRSVPGAIALAVLAAACGGGTPGPDVWAVVDGRQIHRDDVEKAYRRVVAPAAKTPSEEEALTVKLGLVDELITQQVLVGRAPALKVEVTDAEVETAFAERKGNMSEEAFQAQLKERRLTSDDMRQALRKELIVKKVIEREVESKVTVTDQEITDFFNANREQFNVPETQYHIAQIVITPVKDPQLRNRLGDDAGTPEEALRKAQMIMDRLKAGARFGDLAMDYSEDPQSVAQGGDLGFVGISALQQVPPALRNAVTRLQPGNVGLVSQGGHHTIVLLAAKEAAGQRELSTPAVKNSISELLRERKEEVLRTAFLTTARQQAKIVNHLARQIVQSQGRPPNLVPDAPGK